MKIQEGAMAKLYELTDAYAQIQALAEEPETPDGVWDQALADLGGAIEDKVESIAKIIRMLEADADAIQAEIARLTALAHSRRNRASSLKDYLKANLEAAGINKIKLQLFSVAIQPSPPSCRAIDEAAVPQQFKHLIPEIWKVDARAILNYHQETGEEVPGVEITRGTHLRIR
jgi:hypothetical protein